MELQHLIAALADPAAYPHRPPAVEMRQTHASILFFAGTRVYKVKKPVDLGFLDFSTLDRRRHFCEEEVRLNRRLAPDVYLGVAPITRAADGSLHIRGQGKPIEYAVEMVRLPAARMLDHLLEAGIPGEPEIDAIAETLARFHQSAATGPGIDEHGAPDAIASHLNRNLRELQPFAGDVPEHAAPGAPILTTRLWNHLHAWINSRLAAARDLFTRRVAEHRIRDGHGDLHAGNICMIESASGITPIIYDCIEFNPAFRCADVASDLAFLAMDLDLRRRRDLAARLITRYASISGDQGLPPLQPLYRAHFALVRAKVAAIRAREPIADHERSDIWRQAMRYTHLAAGYTLRPSLVIMTGLPGSGKSWAASQFAAPLNALIIRSDEVRKKLAGLAPTHRAQGTDRDRLYAPRMTDLTYDEMLRRARSALAAGCTAVLDATFPTEARRTAALTLAASMNARCIVVHTQASLPVIRERMASRAHDPSEVSDAGLDIHIQARESFELPGEVPPARLIEMTEHRLPEVMISRALDALLAT